MCIIEGDWENVGLGFHIYPKGLEVDRGNSWVVRGLLKWYRELVGGARCRKGGGEWGCGGV
jgi:hypothetical protein